MSDYLNECKFGGDVVKDATVKRFEDGGSVVNFTLLIKEEFTNRAGVAQSRQEFVRVSAWNSVAEKASTLATKGRRLFVFGKLGTRSWKDEKTGEMRYMTQVTALAVNPTAEVNSWPPTSPRLKGTEAARAILQPLRATF